jgi:cellulose biosynthesis protein BcsQ
MANIAREIDDRLVTRAFHVDRLRTKAQHFDYLVIDTPAAGIFQEIAIAAADTIIIPTALDYLAMEALTNTGRTITALDANRKQIIIVPTMYQRNNECEYNLGLLTSRYAGHVTDPIPLCAAVRAATAEGQTVWEYKDRRSRTLDLLRSNYTQVVQWISTPIETVIFGE